MHPHSDSDEGCFSVARGFFQICSNLILINLRAALRESLSGDFGFWVESRGRRLHFYYTGKVFYSSCF